MSRQAGSGLRTYTPKRGHLRAKLLTFFAENPTAMLARAEVCERFGVSIHGVEYAVTLMRRDKQIKTLIGPNREAYYLKGDSTLVKLPKPVKVAKPIREWPSSTYVAPRPIATSIFDLARTL